MKILIIYFQIIFLNKPVFNNLGNHDTFPADQTQKYMYKYILNCDRFILGIINCISNDMADINVRNGGYYSHDIHNSTKLYHLIVFLLLK